MAPVGEAKADWEIICLLAEAMGQGAHFSYASAEAIWEEIRRVWKAGAGISYARLESGGLQWPCLSEDHPGTPLLHTTRFPHGERAALRAIDYRPTDERPSADFPFLLITGRNLYQFNAGTMTARTKNSILRPSDMLDIHPDDARRLSLADGDLVQVASRHGDARLPTRLTPTLRPGEVFATFHTAEIFLNRVTSPQRDRYTETPEYKVTAVRLEAAGRPAGPPRG